MGGWYVRVRSEGGDSLCYFIGKGDVVRLVKGGEDGVLWGEGGGRRGSLDSKFVFRKREENWIGL